MHGVCIYVCIFFYIILIGILIMCAAALSLHVVIRFLHPASSFLVSFRLSLCMYKNFYL